MHELDDLQRIREIDRENMLERIDSMPELLIEALTDLKAPESRQALVGIENGLFVGMGTSAVAAEVALNSRSQHLKAPWVLIRDSSLPSFAGPRSLVCVVSYGGETQETLSALVNALRRGCQVMTISSGGKIKELSSRFQIPHIEVKRGFEPRSAFPLLFVASSLAIELLTQQKDLRKNIQEASADLQDLRSRIGWKVPFEDNPAKKLAIGISKTIPVVYAFRRNGGLARRMKNQLNENSKIPAIFNLLPEACHNEFEAWRKPEEDMPEFSFIFLRPDESDDERARVEESKRTLTEAGMAKVYEVRGLGEERLSQLLSIVYFTDYVTLYLSVLRRIDPTPWERVQELKKRILQRTDFEERLNSELTRTSD